MKSIKHYILEALKINSKSKVLKSKEDIKDLDVFYIDFNSFVNNFIKYFNIDKECLSHESTSDKSIIKDFGLPSKCIIANNILIKDFNSVFFGTTIGQYLLHGKLITFIFLSRHRDFKYWREIENDRLITIKSTIYNSIKEKPKEIQNYLIELFTN
jgi:hypothetical protein